MTKFLATYATSFIIFLAIDAVWLGIIATNMYKKYIGHLLGPVNFVAAAIFYVVYLLGLTYFITYPALLSGNKTVVFVAVQGGLLSALCYATYDLTNQATLKGWPWVLTAIDITWGFALGAFVCGLSFYAVQKLGF